MKTIQSISVVEDVTLVSLHDTPADFGVVAEIFRQLSDAGVDVDMISQTPPHRNAPDISFTVSGEDMGKVVAVSAALRAQHPEMKLSVSGGHSKISVFSEAMRGCPGVAGRVFAAVAEAKADVVMITTSEVDISLLVEKSDMENTMAAIEKAFA